MVNNSRRSRMYMQMALEHKTLYSVLFYPISFLLLIEKLAKLKYQSSLMRSASVVSLVVMLLADIARYWLGARGNLREQVFHLTSFLFLSLCPVLPSLAFSCFFSEHVLPFDLIAGGIYCVFLILEIVSAYCVLREVLRVEAGRFARLKEMTRIQGNSHVHLE